jgi:hypothetical protein
MNEKYNIGDFGQATFIVKKGWKAPITCHGRIIDQDMRNVLFIDNDGYSFIIPKNKFHFEKKEFKIKNP